MEKTSRRKTQKSLSDYRGRCKRVLFMCKKKITREIIIKTLVDSLESKDYIHALWEGGAAAFDRIDEWSDIDLYLIVDDNRISDAVHEVERSLNSLSPIEQKYETQQNLWPEIFQAFYKIKDASKYLLIDIAIMKISSQEKFLEKKIHGNAVFYFNKLNEIPLKDNESMAEQLRKRLGGLRAKFDLFNIFVKKEINRGNSLEAIDLYYNITLSSLVEVLRIKHYPSHHEFKMRYVHYELPAEVVEKLEYLFFVKTIEELQEKYDIATRWFNETMFSLTNYFSKERSC